MGTEMPLVNVRWAVTNGSHTEAAKGRTERQRIRSQMPVLAFQEQGPERGGRELGDGGNTERNILTGVKGSENSAHHTLKTPRLDWDVGSGLQKALQRNLWA